MNKNIIEKFQVNSIYYSKGLRHTDANTDTHTFICIKVAPQT